MPDHPAPSLPPTSDTERKQAERLLVESYDRFQQVTRATRSVVWDWNLVTNGLWWNQMMEMVFGYRVKDLKPDLSSWTDYLHPEDLERTVTGIHQAIDHGDEYWKDEYRFRCADGRYLEVLDCGRVIRDDTGRPVRMIGAMQDISERKKQEEIIRKQADDATQQLSIMYGREERVLELKREINDLLQELGRPKKFAA